MRRNLEDHRRHRTSLRDRQDPHPPRLARPSPRTLCLTAHEPSTTLPLGEKGRLKFLFPFPTFTVTVPAGTYALTATHPQWAAAYSPLAAVSGKVVRDLRLAAVGAADEDVAPGHRVQAVHWASARRPRWSRGCRRRGGSPRPSSGAALPGRRVHPRAPIRRASRSFAPPAACPCCSPTRTGRLDRRRWRAGASSSGASSPDANRRPSRGGSRPSGQAWPGCDA